MESETRLVQIPSQAVAGVGNVLNVNEADSNTNSHTATNSTVKRFSASSVNVNKRFLNQASATASPKTTVKTSSVTVSKATLPSTSRVKFVTGKRSASSPSQATKTLTDFSKDGSFSSGESYPSPMTGTDGSAGKSSVLPPKVWGSNNVSSLLSKRSKDFPTAAEAARGPASTSNYHDAIDSAFASVRSSSASNHAGWDEMMDDSLDFSSDVLEFGDGIQYKVLTHSDELPRPDVPPTLDNTEKETPLSNSTGSENHDANIMTTVPPMKQDRFPPDYDRSWRPAQDNSKLDTKTMQSKADGKVIYDERQDKFRSVQGPRSPPRHNAIRQQIPSGSASLPRAHNDMKSTSPPSVRLFQKQEKERELQQTDVTDRYTIAKRGSNVENTQDIAIISPEAQKQAMQEAAERARKRRQEEELARQQEAERARRKALLLAEQVAAGKTDQKKSEGKNTSTSPISKDSTIATSSHINAGETPIEKSRDSRHSSGSIRKVSITDPVESSSNSIEENRKKLHSRREHVGLELPSSSVEMVQSIPPISPLAQTPSGTVHVRLPRKHDIKHIDNSSLDDVMLRIKGVLGDGFAAQVRNHASEEGKPEFNKDDSSIGTRRLSDTLDQTAPAIAVKENDHTLPLNVKGANVLLSKGSDDFQSGSVRINGPSKTIAHLEATSRKSFSWAAISGISVCLPQTRRRNFGRLYQSKYMTLQEKWKDTVLERFPYRSSSIPDFSIDSSKQINVRLPSKSLSERQARFVKETYSNSSRGPSRSVWGSVDGDSHQQHQNQGKWRTSGSWKKGKRTTIPRE